MGIEYVLYFYGAVCICMIFFNFAYALLLRGSERRMLRRVNRYRTATDRQMARLARGEVVEPRYLRMLHRRLRRLRNLAAFDRVLRGLLREQQPGVQAFLAALQPCILDLAFVYRRRENTQAAYYTYVLAAYMSHRHLQIQTLQDVLLDYMARENLYCRVNALRALYAFGSADHILKALQIQDHGKVLLHEKILTEGLLTFTGDHDELCSLLWDQRNTLSVHTQLAVFNYIRFQTGDYGARMLAFLQEEHEDKELRLAAIRYCGRYAYEPALELLLTFAMEDDPLRWEYATVSVSALAGFRDPRVVPVLKRALHSFNWFVRYAAAVSLEQQGVRYEDLQDVLTGDDRYAREMITYRLEARRLQKAEV